MDLLTFSNININLVKALDDKIWMLSIHEKLPVVVPPATNSLDIDNYTSFALSQATFSIDNLPPIKAILEVETNGMETEEPVRSRALADFCEHLSGIPLRESSILPTKVCMLVEGWRIALWQTMDSRVREIDIILRMKASGIMINEIARLVVALYIRQKFWRLYEGGLRGCTPLDDKHPRGLLSRLSDLQIIHNTVWEASIVNDE
ncbi:hypothetical protein AOQ84DRAFT_382632 [Glonium stellatum]|uniref:Uncharacterized protein n=1 Tax=Glonium stellatum TaxID=574774 RepID=A0A8E2EPG3_9PEZI|nr:hypothetical protein AOQ84DRAFT_382632 [Glonium stellatum]